MLRWRLILGPIIIGLLAALCWADMRFARPGLCLVPLAIALCLLASQEMLRLFRASGRTPDGWAIGLGTLLPVLSACAPIAWLEYPLDCPVGRLGWLSCGLAAGLIIALVGEMRRYTAPGHSIPNLSTTALSVLYVGGLMGFLVQLRLLPVAGGVARGGMLALLSMIVVVKLTDIGAYTAGRLLGRHKMAPTLSPGKTWEGVVGGLLLAVGGAWIALGPLAEWLGAESTHEGVGKFAVAIVYGLLVGGAGIVGDLAESLLKRDAGVKDSSDWLPGFGGVLDLLDSLLVASPVAYFCWVSGLMT